VFTFENSTPSDSFNPMTTLREAFAASNLSWDDFESTICDTLDELYAEEETKKLKTIAANYEPQDPATLSWEDLFDSIIRPWCIANLSNGSTINDLDTEDYNLYRRECFNYLQQAVNAYVNIHKAAEKLESTSKLTKKDISDVISLLFGDGIRD